MSLLAFFQRRGSAPVARERLQILLAHERAIVGQSDLIIIIRDEIFAVIRKHVQIEPDKVKVKMERGDSVSVLEVDVELPIPASLRELPPEGRIAIE
jgi:cell division topological specificity factor